MQAGRTETPSCGVGALSIKPLNGQVNLQTFGRGEVRNDTHVKSANKAKIGGDKFSVIWTHGWTGTHGRCAASQEFVGVSDGFFRHAGADVTVTEPSSSDSRVERSDPYANVDEALIGGEASYISQPLTPEKEDALQAATVANLRAALMSKNSLLSLKADMLGEDSSLLFEYLPKGTHSLSRKFVFLYFLFIDTLSEIFSEKKILSHLLLLICLYPVSSPA